MKTQTRSSRHNKFFSAENIVGIFGEYTNRRRIYQQYSPPK